MKPGSDSRLRLPHSHRVVATSGAGLAEWDWPTERFVDVFALQVGRDGGRVLFKAVVAFAQ